MELRTYHLRTWRVSGHEKDLTPKIEDITVKLQGGINTLEKYCKFLLVRGFMKSKPPQIVKVIERNKAGKWIDLKESDIEEAQLIVDKVLSNSKVNEKIDYKSEFEEQKKRIDALEKRLAARETPETEAYNHGSVKVIEKAKALFSEKELLQAKAKELNIDFRSNLGNEKLLLKIQDIEPEYKI